MCMSYSHQNRPGARFCACCGFSLRRVCLACGAETYKSHAMYCSRCGSEDLQLDTYIAAGFSGGDARD
jgi:predicted amidophosphoribosyltransferase